MEGHEGGTHALFPVRKAKAMPKRKIYDLKWTGDDWALQQRGAAPGGEAEARTSVADGELFDMRPKKLSSTRYCPRPPLSRLGTGKSS